MSTSPLGYYVPLRSTVLDTDEPVSAGDALAIANNTAHFADQAAQVRVQWAGALELPPLPQNAVAYNTDRWYVVWSSGQLLLHEAAEGIYALRTHVAARSQTGTKYNYAVAIARNSLFGEAQVREDIALETATGGTGLGYVLRGDTSSTSTAWVIDGVLTMSQADIAGQFLYREEAVLRESGGSDNTTARVVAAYVNVLVNGIAAEDDFELNAVHVAEFIG